MTLSRPVRPYPAAMVNITNRCTLRCQHCFIYRDGNPNQSKDEMSDARMIERLGEIRDLYELKAMLWMGGEPLLRPNVIIEGSKLFNHNTVTTNGTLPLVDFGRGTYVVSLDGPPDLNDAIRGKNTFNKVIENIASLPKKEDFRPTVTCQTVVTRTNQDRLLELVELLLPTRLEGMTFSFYSPAVNDRSELTWGSLEKRDEAVLEVIRLKEKYPEFVWNKTRALELTLAKNAPSVTKDCPAKRFVLPLYLDGEDFINTFCCYGNDVDCDLCGAWVVFRFAAKVEAGDFGS